MSKRPGLLSVWVLSTGLSAQEAGPCGEEVPTLHLNAPAVEEGLLSLRWGEETRGIEIEARLDTRDLDLQAFSISVETVAGPLQVSEVRSSGVWQEAAGGGFHRTELAWRTRDQAGPAHGFISVFVGSLPEFSPPRGDHPLVRAWYDVDVVQEGDPILDSPVRIEFRDGLRGRGQPVPNIVTSEGRTAIPCAESLDFQIRVALPVFLRGDANADGVLDVSDPVTLLRSQFRGDALIRCDDAADSNDDRRVDLTDAIYVFNYLFRGGPPPSAPFPEPGLDVTDDDLDCEVSIVSS